MREEGSESSYSEGWKLGCNFSSLAFDVCVLTCARYFKLFHVDLFVYACVNICVYTHTQKEMYFYTCVYIHT